MFVYNINNTEERKRREFESSLWQQMTDRALNQLQEKFEINKSNYNISTYGETYVRPEFELKKLGSKIDENVGYTDKIIYLTLLLITGVY